MNRYIIYNDIQKDIWWNPVDAGDIPVLPLSHSVMPSGGRLGQCCCRAGPRRDARYSAQVPGLWWTVWEWAQSWCLSDWGWWQGTMDPVCQATMLSSTAYSVGHGLPRLPRKSCLKSTKHIPLIYRLTFRGGGGGSSVMCWESLNQNQNLCFRSIGAREENHQYHTPMGLPKTSGPSRQVVSHGSGFSKQVLLYGSKVRLPGVGPEMVFFTDVSVKPQQFAKKTNTQCAREFVQINDSMMPRLVTSLLNYLQCT